MTPPEDPRPPKTPSPIPDELDWSRRLAQWILGAPRNLWDRTIFHKVALVPVLAWVGMGADGLSSSAYGPDESFRALQLHLYVAPLVILASVLTIAIISIAYSRVIENFPHGGGGYVVASRLLGPGAGVFSGCALIVDYVLTITVSIAAGGDALFSLLPHEWHTAKLVLEAAALGALVVMNLRGVRESVISVAPVFFAFVVSHIVLIGGVIFLHWSRIPVIADGAATGCAEGLGTLGLVGMGAIFLRAYSMGAGTYTGIEAVSNGVSILREPKVQSGQRTMAYMAVSLAVVSSGLFAGYLLAGIGPTEGQTMNAVLAADAFGQGVLGSLTAGHALLWLTLLSEAGILLIAAQTGFIDGPRVMANMALDGWLPRRFSLLSHRLTIQDGVLLFGAASLAALLYTRGNTTLLVLMYSINVFITFSLTELSMVRLYWGRRHEKATLLNKIYIHVIGLVLCGSILVVMIVEKFTKGGWLTLVITFALLGACLLIRRYYRGVREQIRRIDDQLGDLPVRRKPVVRPLNPDDPTAILLVDRYGGVGIHAIFAITRLFPGTFRNMVFVSVGIVDSDAFKGIDALDELRAHKETDLKRYVEFARRLGLAASYETTIGTDVVDAAEELCLVVAKRFGTTVVFGSKLVFRRERWYQALMHNHTNEALQSRLQWAGLTMTILPIRVLG
ncbi:MAG: APC family permease [Candidatus Coatesbacteria bacterium]